MNIWDYLLLALIVLALAAALRKVIRDSRNGKHCHGNCGCCQKSCKRK